MSDRDDLVDVDGRVRPTLRQLEYFVAVAETLNFREAALRVYVSQPALSAQIQQLEDFLGVQLFERNRRRVLITRAGSAALASARQVLREVDGLVDTARGWQCPLGKTLHLGVIPTIAPYMLPVALPRVRRRYPELRLVLFEERTSVLLQMLGEGRLDAALLALPHGRGDLTDRPLFEEAFFVAVPRGHHLACREEVHAHALRDEGVLLLEDGHCLRDQTLAICQSAGAHELMDLRASSLSTLLQMVRGGIGITMVPEMAIPRETLGGDELKVIPFAAPSPRRTVALSWRKSARDSVDLELLAQTLADGWPKVEKTQGRCRTTSRIRASSTDSSQASDRCR